MMDDVDKNKFERMDPMHHLLAGVKAKFTDDVVAAIDKCRRSTGGAGYASHSGFPDLYYNTSPTPNFFCMENVAPNTQVRLVQV